MNAQETKEKAIILDSVQGVKLIKQFIDCDIAKAENKIYKLQDSNTKQRIKNLQDQNKDLMKSYTEKSKEADELYKANATKDKIISKEHNKSNMFMVAGLVSIGFTTILLLVR